MEVLVVVLALGGGTHLDRALESLRAQTHTKTTFAIVGTHETLATKAAATFKNARVEAEDPTRICEAANSLADQWGSFDLVVFTRDDVRFAPDAIDRACDAVRETLVAAVGAKVYAAETEDVLVEVGMSADRFGVPFSRLEGAELDQAQYDVRRQTLYSSFAFLAVRGPVLDAVGGFDPALRGAGNDLDLCWRIRLSGEDVLVSPDIRVWQIAEPEEDEESVRLAQRNRVWMVAKNYGPLRALLFSVEGLSFALASALAAVASGRAGDSRKAFAAHGWVISRVPTLLRDRRATQRLRGVRDRTVVRFMLGATARIRLRSDLREAEGTGGFTQAVVNILRVLGGRWLAIPILLGLFLLLAGRHLLTGPLPSFGRLGPPDQAALDYVRSLAAHWQDVSVGSASPSPPGLFVSGIAGLVALGSVQLAQRVLLILGLLVAAWTCARSLRPLVSHTSGRVAAALVYVLGPLLWNALANGDMGAVTLAVLLPPIALRFAYLSGHPGVEDDKPQLRRKLELAVLLALATALEPAAIWPVATILAGWAVGSVVVGGAHRSALTMWYGVQAIGGAFVLLLPWSFSLLFGDAAARAFAAAPTEIPFLDLIRFDTGRFGATPLAFGLVALALLPLLLAQEDRFAWATRWWGVAAVSFFVTWLVGLGLLPALGRAEVLLLPAGLAFAFLSGIGVEAIRRNLPEFQVGIHQPLSVVLVVLGVAGLVSPLAALPGGRLGQPPDTDWRSTLAWQVALAEEEGPFLTVFVGPSVPGDPQPIGNDLYLSVAWPGGPSLQELWFPRTTTGGAELKDAVELAVQGAVPYVGRLLSPFSVRYVAVPEGEPELVETLSASLDLTLEQEDLTGTVFQNRSWRPQVAAADVEAPGGRIRDTTRAGAPPAESGPGWLLSPPSTWEGKTGPFVRAGVTFDGSFRLETDGESVEPADADGWAMQFETSPDRNGKLVLDAGPVRPVLVVLVALMWIVTAGAIIGLGRTRERP